MKTPIQATKKVQKLVTKSILLLVVFFSQATLSQENHVSDVFRIIVNDFERKDSTICLLDIYDKSNIKSRLQKYYDFRIKGKPFISTFALDSTTGEYYIDSTTSKKGMKLWKKKYNALDVSFSKKEIKSIIDNELGYSVDYLYNIPKYSLEWGSDSGCINRISKPFFNSKKDALFIIHAEKYGILSTKWKAYVFRKKNDKWILVTKIKNFGM